MLTVLTFSILLFALVTAFYLNIIKRRGKRKNILHNPMKIILCLIYCVNLSGFLIAGYLILSYEINIVIEQWKDKFFLILIIIVVSTPIVYFSRQIGNNVKLSITKIRILLIIINIYPLINIFKFYNQ